jgi:hypothetical protein
MINPNDEIQYIVDLIDDYAEAHKQLTYCESIKPAIKALEMSKSSQPSIAGKEMEALGSEAYEAFCSKYAEAQKRYTSLKLKIETAKLKIETWRTESATNRQIEKITR